MALQTKSKVNLVLALIIVALSAVFIVLNMETVEVNLILATVEMKLALLIIAVLCLGFLLGWLFKSLLVMRPKSKARPAKVGATATSPELGGKEGR